MVMSIVYNQLHKNTARSAEVNVLRASGADFYGVEMRVLIARFVNVDCDVAQELRPRGLGVAGDGQGHDGRDFG